VSKRKFWLIVIVLLIPVVPFLLLGHWLEPLVESWFSDGAIGVAGESQWWTAPAIIFGLTVDILLPIPSSVLLTFAGRYFGGWGGAAVGWIGLNLSAAVGFWLSRHFGQPIVDRFSTQEDVEGVRWMDATSGWWSLVACRPLPILAEASVIFAGLSRMPVKRFWPPVILANGVIALLYGLLGDYASQQQWFGIAVIGSMILPLLFIVGFRVWQSSQRGARVPSARSND